MLQRKGACLTKQELLSAKIARRLMSLARFAVYGTSLRASRGPLHCLVFSLDHPKNGQPCLWAPSAPTVAYRSLLWALHPTLAPSHPPKANASLGLPSLEVWRRALGCTPFPEWMLQSTARQWSRVLSVGCPVSEGTEKGEVLWGTTQTWKAPVRHCHTVSPCPSCYGYRHAAWFLHSCSTASSFIGCLRAPTPGSIFICLIQN